MQIYIQSSMHILSVVQIMISDKHSSKTHLNPSNKVINYFKHLLMAEHYESDKGSQSNFPNATN